MTIGKKIIKLRNTHNLSQEELAARLNVSRQTVSKWENDVAMPDAYNVVELAKVFNCSTDELLLGQEEERQENDNQIIEAIDHVGGFVKRHWQKYGYYLLGAGIVLLLFSFVFSGAFGSFWGHDGFGGMAGHDSVLAGFHESSRNTFGWFMLLPLGLAIVLITVGIILIAIDVKKRKNNYQKRP